MSYDFLNFYRYFSVILNKKNSYRPIFWAADLKIYTNIVHSMGKFLGPGYYFSAPVQKAISKVLKRNQNYNTIKWILNLWYLKMRWPRSFLHDDHAYLLFNGRVPKFNRQNGKNHLLFYFSGFCRFYGQTFENGFWNVDRYDCRKKTIYAPHFYVQRKSNFHFK